MRTLYLARHGAARGGEGRYIGDTDLPLRDKGVREAEGLGRYFADKSLETIACSDLRRAHDTAMIVARVRPAPILVHSGLREISMGAWEGLPRSEAVLRFPEEYRARGADLANHRVAGGESFADCARRTLRTVDGILARTRGDMLIVAHAGVNRTLLFHWTGTPLERLFEFTQDTGGLNTIEIDDGVIHVATVNSVVHLTDAA